MTDEERKIVIVFDQKQWKPACVLLQACLGGDSHVTGRLFDATSWLLAPTEDMKRYELTLSEWQKVAKTVNEKNRPLLPTFGEES